MLSGNDCRCLYSFMCANAFLFPTFLWWRQCWRDNQPNGLNVQVNTGLHIAYTRGISYINCPMYDMYALPIPTLMENNQLQFELVCAYVCASGCVIARLTAIAPHSPIHTHIIQFDFRILDILLQFKRKYIIYHSNRT